MSRPPIEHIELNEYLGLSLCHPDSECRTENWWLYDKRAGMNVALRAKTRDEALVKAIEYWAKCSARFEKAYTELKAEVDKFVDTVRPPEEDEDWRP